MKSVQLKIGRVLGLLLAGLLASGAMAEKPEWVEGGKQRKSERSEAQSRPNQHEQRGGKAIDHQTKTRRGDHFDDEQRRVVQHYYSEQHRVGRCPPGLAKKHNGCMPPGQARKWAMGRPLPRGVVYYELPPAIVVQLGVPPAGHRYVRVASDILLIAIGTGMVIDALEDLGR
jgi:Ni/Co efflux regulator RcnB